MNSNWWELPDMSVGQAQDFMDGIRAFNKSVAVSAINNGLNINEDMRAVSDYNRRIENKQPLCPDKKYFVDASFTKE